MTSTTQPYTQSRAYMDTIVTIQVPSGDDPDARDRVDRAFGWFREVERRCSRFESDSELRSLCSQTGVAVAVSPLLYRAIEFAVAVAGATGGAFDPTVGRAMEQRGFNRNYRTGAVIASDVPDAGGDYRSVVLDAAGQTVTLKRPVVLDLGAVAKGLAMDLAANELSGLDGYLINAGGDILVHGRDAAGGTWPIGIKDPFEPTRLVSLLSLTDRAVCTSGGYERPAANGAGHHIITPSDQRSPEGLASVTVVAESAMVADALSTAVFVLGREAGLALLEGQGVDALIIDRTGSLTATGALKRYL